VFRSKKSRWVAALFGVDTAFCRIFVCVAAVRLGFFEAYWNDIAALFDHVDIVRIGLHHDLPLA
jgi:hypothetical protein